MKREGKKNLSPLFLFFLILILFSACVGEVHRSNGVYWLKYYFINESPYLIFVTLDQDYNYRSGEIRMSKASPISLDSGSSVIVEVQDDFVNFSWTASDKSNNRYIYTDKNGSKVTFKER
jgi:hypothetical protein